MWNLFKLELAGRFQETNRVADLGSRVPYIPTAIDHLYARHFDVSSAGGRLIKSPLITAGFKKYLNIVVRANRNRPPISYGELSSQIELYSLIYWSGRIIDGPAATVYTVFPGIWVPMPCLQNFIPGGLQWIDWLSISLYIQKMSVMGVRIQKPVPLLTPWSGVLFQTFDAPFGIGAVTGPMKDAFGTSIDLLTAFYSGNPDVGEQIKSAFNGAIDQIFSPALFDAFSGIPNPYGTDMNGADASLGANINNAFKNVVSNALADIKKKLTAPIIAGIKANAPGLGGGQYAKYAERFDLLLCFDDSISLQNIKVLLDLFLEKLPEKSKIMVTYSSVQKFPESKRVFVNPKSGHLESRKVNVDPYVYQTDSDGTLQGDSFDIYRQFRELPDDQGLFFVGEKDGYKNYRFQWNEYGIKSFTEIVSRLSDKDKARENIEKFDFKGDNSEVIDILSYDHDHYYHAKRDGIHYSEPVENYSIKYLYPLSFRAFRVVELYLYPEIKKEYLNIVQPIQKDEENYERIRMKRKPVFGGGNFFSFLEGEVFQEIDLLEVKKEDKSGGPMVTIVISNYRRNEKADYLHRVSNYNNPPGKQYPHFYISKRVSRPQYRIIAGIDYATLGDPRFGVFEYPKEPEPEKKTVKFFRSGTNLPPEEEEVFDYSLPDLEKTEYLDRYVEHVYYFIKTQISKNAILQPMYIEKEEKKPLNSFFNGFN